MFRFEKKSEIDHLKYLFVSPLHTFVFPRGKTELEVKSKLKL